MRIKSAPWLIKIVCVLLFAFTTGAAPAQSNPSSMCLSQGYTVGFFNGVWNEPDDAVAGTMSLRALIGDQLNGQRVTYTSFYNTTMGLLDLFETWVQRANEINKSVDMGNRGEFFWDLLSGQAPLFETLLVVYPGGSALVDAGKALLTDGKIGALGALFKSEPTAENYAEHNAQLTFLAAQRQKLMLVAHSQGNLFMNHAYDFISPQVGITGVQAVHIAPASPTRKGDYRLAEIDLVIDGLKILGQATVLPSNLTAAQIPRSTKDPSGHELIGTYLDPSRGGRSEIKSIVGIAMKNLLVQPGSGQGCDLSIAASAAPVVGAPVHFIPTIPAGTGFNITQYQWDYGDGTPVALAAASGGSVPAAIHTYAKAGTYNVVLSVTNLPSAPGVSGLTVTASLSVSVGPAVQPPPQSTPSVPAATALNACGGTSTANTGTFTGTFQTASVALAPVIGAPVSGTFSGTYIVDNPDGVACAITGITFTGIPQFATGIFPGNLVYTAPGSRTTAPFVAGPGMFLRSISSTPSRDTMFNLNDPQQGNYPGYRVIDATGIVESQTLSGTITVN